MARVISDPPHDHIWFEHATTVVNIAAGEQVRWLPRREASGLQLSGSGFSEDPSIPRFCVVASSLCGTQRWITSTSSSRNARR
ncbi:DUF6879 family protein [Streptomyces albireticuli]|uniref:DUF6879 family protein n=1 Tax=Streptomyces albireticuli TaxID=1940 RepID=UPI003689E468